MPGLSLPTSSSRTIRCAGGACARLANGDGDMQVGGIKAAQRGGERLGVLVPHLEMDDAGELAGEARHPAAGPVGAEALGDVGQQIDDSRAITTDHGQYQRRRHVVCPRVNTAE